MTAPTIGLLYPGHAAEDDFAWFARTTRAARLPLVHTSVGEDAHRVDALLDLGSPQRLALGAEALAGEQVDAVLWACTSGSFVFGWDGACTQADRVGDLLGVPASSTSLAFVRACHHLGLRRVAVAASYPADVAERFVELLGHGGVEVTSLGSSGIVTAVEVGRLGRPQVTALVTGVDLDGAEAVLVPDTAMHTLRWLDELERAVGVPVLTANQVTVWEGLRMLGEVPVLEGSGALFAGGVG